MEQRSPTHDFDIREDDLTGEKVRALLDYHLAEMARVSPPDGVNALPIEGLQQPDVTFWTLWEGKNVAGFGALREIDAAHGEIKSMRAAPDFLGRGVGKTILLHLIDQARSRDYTCISLETGRTEDYEAAHALYRKHGFEECPPFGSYKDDGFSMCMTRAI